MIRNAAAGIFGLAMGTPKAKLSLFQAYSSQSYACATGATTETARSLIDRAAAGWIGHLKSSPAKWHPGFVRRNVQHSARQ